MLWADKTSKHMKKNFKIKTPTKKEMGEYRKYLEKEARKLRLNSEDLSNLTDLYYMITPDIHNVLKLNKMDKWFHKLFARIQEITIPELYPRRKKKKPKR